jgi:hypothetical protein
LYINISHIFLFLSNTKFFDTIHNFLFYLLLSLIILYIFFIYNAFKCCGKEKDQRKIKKKETISKVPVMINEGADMVENMIGKKVFLVDDLGDGEMLMCSDTVTAVLLEENSMSVRCKTSGNEFWTIGKNAFFSECEAKQAFKMG